MNIGWKPLAWSAAAVLFLLSLATPLNTITLFLVMTPYVVLYTSLKPVQFALYMLGIGIAAFVLAGASAPVVLALALFFVVPSIAMGHLYKRGASARRAVLVGFVIVLAQLLLELAIFSLMSGFDLGTQMKAMLENSLTEWNWPVEAARALGDQVVNALPMLLIMIAFLFTIVTHGLARVGLRWSGVHVPALPQARTWRLPRSLVFYFLIALIASFALPEEGGGYWEVAIGNLLPVLVLAFLIQTIGFAFFLADAKKWPRAVAVLMAGVVVIFTTFQFPFYLVGLLDTAFPLRRYFVK